MANLCKGDHVEFDESVFTTGSFSRWGSRPGKYIGKRRISGVIETSGYGRETTAHWLTIRVESCQAVEGQVELIAVGKALRRKAKTVYGGLVDFDYGDDHGQAEETKRAQKLYAASGCSDQIRADILRSQANGI